MEIKLNRMKIGYIWPDDGTMSLVLEFPIAECGAMTIVELERLCKSKLTITITGAADEK